MAVWPEAETSVLGDWTAPDASGGAAAKKRKGKKDAPKSTAGWYADKASKSTQLRVRRRFMAATRAFIERAGGFDALTYETSWADVIPSSPPPAELAQFYGTIGAFEASAPK
jgi:hypothetical protein